MKFLLCLIWSCIVCIQSNGHYPIVMRGNVGPVYYSGLVDGEAQYQNQAIAILCNEYIKKYYPFVQEKVFLNIGRGEMSSYTLVYDKYERDNWNYAEENRPVQGFGIVIEVTQPYNIAASVLKILDYSLNHLPELKKASNDYYDQNEDDRPDDWNTEPSLLLEIIESAPNQKIKDVLDRKVYINSAHIAEDVPREYFFQNDKYYFVDYYDYNTIYLELNQVFQIINGNKLGILIFDTDTTGYFYNKESKQLSPRFTIKDKAYPYHYDYSTYDYYKNRIYFAYKTYDHKIKKFIYLTDKLFLIQKVDEFEDDMITKELEKDLKDAPKK